MAYNVRGTTPLFLPLSKDWFLLGKNNGATTTIFLTLLQASYINKGSVVVPFVIRRLRRQLSVIVWPILGEFAVQLLEQITGCKDIFPLIIIEAEKSCMGNGEYVLHSDQVVQENLKCLFGI